MKSFSRAGRTLAGSVTERRNQEERAQHLAQHCAHHGLVFFLQEGAFECMLRFASPTIGTNQRAANCASDSEGGVSSTIFRFPEEIEKIFLPA